MRVARGLCKKCYAKRGRRGTLPQKRQTGVITRPGRGGNTYRYLRRPDHPLAAKDGYVAEHRMVAWDAGLFTDRSFDVHHRNGDGLDNRVENLEPVSAVEHRRHHARTDGIKNQTGTWGAVEGPCAVDGCDLPKASQNWCTAHNTRFVRWGDPLRVLRVNSETVTPYVLFRPEPFAVTVDLSEVPDHLRPRLAKRLTKVWRDWTPLNAAGGIGTTDGLTADGVLALTFEPSENPD